MTATDTVHPCPNPATRWRPAIWVWPRDVHVIPDPRRMRAQRELNAMIHRYGWDPMLRRWRKPDLERGVILARVARQPGALAALRWTLSMRTRRIRRVKPEPAWRVEIRRRIRERAAGRVP